MVENITTAPPHAEDNVPITHPPIAEHDAKFSSLKKRGKKKIYEEGTLAEPLVEDGENYEEESLPVTLSYDVEQRQEVNVTQSHLSHSIVGHPPSQREARQCSTGMVP